MSLSTVPRNAYTDAPEQHPNLILGSLQLLFWLFFRPSAWRNHLTRIDPALRPNTIKSSRIRWRNPDLWRLLIQTYLVLLLPLDLLVSLVMLVLGQPGEDITVFMTCGLAAVVVGIFTKSITLLGCVLGIPLGFALGMTEGFAGAVKGIAFGVPLGIALGVAEGIAADLVVSLAITVTFVSFLLGAAGVLQGLSLPEGLTGSVAVFLVETLYSWRSWVIAPLLAGLNSYLYQRDKRHTQSGYSLLRWHSAFWDESQQLPLWGLDNHLVLVMERNRVEGLAAIKYLITTNQSWAVPEAQIKLDARNLDNCADMEAISKVHQNLLTAGELQSPVSSLLRRFSRISKDVEAALDHQSNYNQRSALSSVADHLDGWVQELTRSSDKYAVRFLPIARSWYEIVSHYVQELAKTIELRQEIDNPYINGVPLTEQQQIFTGRTDIATRLEQLLLDRRRPPLLLYGQRRMGKTSLLNNLGRLLPTTIVPMFVDLQGAPSAASDHAGFLYNIARGMRDSAKRQSAFTLPPLTREALSTDPFTCFDEWLDQVEQTLDANTALLALDEFEKLDSAISKGRFDEEDVLGMLRHLIQHRPRFKVLLSGSHTIEEFQRWASYLINVQVVHISYLKEEEARKLIEQPIPDFTLRYEPDAVQRVLQLTRCHPNLVQLLCNEIIVLKNEQHPSIRRMATLADVEAAVPEALSSGSFFFADIQNNQVNADGLAILRFLAAQGEGAIVSRETLSRQFPDNLNSTLNLLLRRELLEPVGDRYRFQVELIRRWFAQKR